MFLALFICVLFISLMQSANGTQFLITTSLALSFAATPSSSMVSGDAVPLTSTYASPQSHILDFRNEF